MIGNLQPDEIDGLLARGRVGRLACSAGDHPYIVPITYAYDGDYVYSYSGLGRKVEVMRAQPRVCFQVDEIDGPTSWRSVVAEGLYEELTDDARRREALHRLTGDGVEVVGRGPDASRRIVVFRVKLTEKSGRYERRDA